MTAPPAPYRLSWHHRMSEIDREQWNALALPLETPFLEWEWLNLLEESGSMSEETGWLPCHLAVRRGGRLIGAAPLYVKTHSEGEFVFDYPWAEVAQKLGIPYYPKLVGMTPATPVPGYRFLTAPGTDEARLTVAMLDTIIAFCRHNRLSGVNFLFVDPAWRQRVTGVGFSAWVHSSFAWENDGCATFDDYLARFNTNQRRNIRREERKIAGRGIRIRAHEGEDIPAGLLPVMYRYYLSTNDKFGPWGCRYLTESFFDAVVHKFRDRLVLMAAWEDDRGPAPVGMSMLVRKKDRLYGRYWGSREVVDSLHFNVCYYAPIRWCIEKGVRRFDPGLGGPHKARRGFTAVANISLHHFCDHRLRRIMEHNMPEINRQETARIEAVNRRIPFARTGPAAVR